MWGEEIKRSKLPLSAQTLHLHVLYNNFLLLAQLGEPKTICGSRVPILWAADSLSNAVFLHSFLNFAALSSWPTLFYAYEAEQS